MRILTVSLIALSLAAVACSSPVDSGPSPVVTDTGAPCASHEGLDYDVTFTPRGEDTCGFAAFTRLEAGWNADTDCNGPLVPTADMCSESGTVTCVQHRDEAPGMTMTIGVECRYSQDAAHMSCVFRVTRTGTDPCETTYDVEGTAARP